MNADYPTTTVDRARILRAIVPACLAIFLADFWIGKSVAIGVLYIIPVLISPWRGSRRFTLAVAAGCTLLTFAALWVPVVQAAGVDSGELLDHFLFPAINVALAVFAIWVSANLALMRLSFEKRLLSDRETIGTTLASIADAVITTDESRRVTYLNRAAEELGGTPLSEALGQPFDDVFPLRSVFEVGSGDSAAFEGPRNPSGTTVLLSEGLEIPIDQSVAPIRDAEGSFRGRVIVFRNVTERRKHEREIKRLAYRDPLTGLPNRASLWDRLGLEVAHARRGGDLLALFFIDLDGFKAINDSLGHRAGDRLLCVVAQRLREALREGDTVARLGGDEFTVLVPSLQNDRDAVLVASKILACFREPIVIDGRPVAVWPSVGVALYPTDAEDPDALLNCADQAMYRCKEAGGNDWRMFSEPISGESESA